MGRDVAKTPFEVRRRAGYRQEQVLAVIRSSIEQPSYREIMDALGMSPDAKGNLHRMIYSLERRGDVEIERDGSRPRIRIKR
jgi:uncharacterized membrane protein